MNRVDVRFVLGVTIVMTICLLGALTSDVLAQSDPRVGSWELNLAKSTFSPGPPPMRQTLWFKEVNGGLTALMQGIDATGKPIAPDASNFSIYFDSKNHPTGNGDYYDSSNWKRISANKYVVNRMKAKRVVLTSTNVVSNDGRTMTVTTTGVGEDGRPVNNVRVYDKQ